MHRSIEDHFAEYRRNGYTIFKGYMPSDQVARVRQTVDPEFHRLHAEHPERIRASITNLLNREDLAHFFKDHILNPALLDFAEHVMGPFVQLDSYEITGYPSRPLAERKKVDRWHRDAFSYSEVWARHGSSCHREDRVYTAPTACNCITYLQDMNEATGHLRLLTDSHLDYTFISDEEVRNAQSGEQLVELEAGDMVYTHNEILHAGSINTSGEIRYFISAYFQRFGLPHRDTFRHPLVEAIKDEARALNDRRILRLFGEDDHLEGRERAAWAQIIAEDRAARNEG